MKKAALTFLLLCCIIFSACGKASSHAASFSLDVINPTTKVQRQRYLYLYGRVKKPHG